MSLEGGSTPESLKTPETAEEMAQRYLSFQTYGTKQEKEIKINNALKTPKVMESAAALVEAAKKYGMERVIECATRVQEDMHQDAAANKIPFTDSSMAMIQDLSGFLIDLGLQYKPKPAETDPNVKTPKESDPFAETEKGERLLHTIADRKLAYYAHSAYLGADEKSGLHKEDKEQARVWKNMIDAHKDLYADTYELLGKRNGRNGLLTEAQLTKLGRALHIASERIQDEGIDLSVRPVAAEASEPINQPVAEEEVTPMITEAPSVVPADAISESHAESAAPQEPHPKIVEVVAALESEEDLHHNTVGKEMRDQLRSLGNGSHEKPASPENKAEKKGNDHEKKDVKHETHDKKEKHGDEDDNHDDHGHAEPFRPTPGGILNAAGHSIWYIPSYIGLYAVPEVAKTFWESAKGMFGVFWKLAKKGFSFKALNENASGGGGGHKKEEHKADHGGGHDDHGGHGHDAHGGDHGKKKDDHGHGGGHGGGGHH